MATADEILRLHYYERQYLGASDLEDQQTYLRDMRRRHNIAHHVWGIVTGLQLVEVPVAGDPTAVDVFIQPGMAIDGFGREIIVMAPSKLDPALFASFADDNYRTVWISYDQQLTQQPTAGYAQCNVANQYGRIQETFAIQVDPKAPTHEDVTVNGQPVNPTSTNISIPADDSVPYQELPDDTTDPLWLVQLGAVHWDGTAGQQKFKPSNPPTRLSSGRAYVGVVAQTIYGPVPEPVVDPKNPDPANDVAKFFVQPRFLPSDPDAAGFAEIIGRLQVDGRFIAMKDALLYGTKLQFQDTAGQNDGVPLWLQRISGPGGAGFDLRVHIGDKPDAGNRLSVGTGPADGTAEKTTFDVKGDDTVDIPTGTLSFGQTVRQMLNLWQAKYGIGVQNSAFYMRTDGDFFWYNGGTPNNNHGDPGGGSVLMSLSGGGNLYVENDVGIGTTSPEAQLHISGGQGDLTSSEGDLKIGNDSYRLKIGVTLGGGAPGDVRIRSQGGTSRLILGSGNVDTLSIQNSNIGMGTLTPQKMLSVNGGMNIDQANVDSGFLEPGLTFGDSSGEGISSKRTAGGNLWGLDLYTAFNPRLSITNLGLVGINTTAPNEYLDVRGNIKLGPSGELWALGCRENMYLLRGTVNADASIAGGSGFTVNKTAAGNYLIVFNTPFFGVPSASATQVFPFPAPFGAGGDTRDNCVIDGLNNLQMKVVTGNNTGAHADRGFTFIVVGSR